MAKLGGLVVDGARKVELLSDSTRSEIEVSLDDFDELLGSLVGSAVGVDVDGAGLGYTDSVTELDQRSLSEASSDERLSNPSGEVGSRSVDLREILAREGTTTVGTPATVGVDDDLSASDTSITLRTTNDEEATGLEL